MYVFFPFVDLTLNDILTPEDPADDCSSGAGGVAEQQQQHHHPVPEGVARRLLHQLLDAIAFCHRQGVMHRNLKPKHLLLKLKSSTTTTTTTAAAPPPPPPALGRGTLLENLDHLVLLVADFALVRAMGVQQHNITTEVVGLRVP